MKFDLFCFYYGVCRTNTSALLEPVFRKSWLMAFFFGSFGRSTSGLLSEGSGGVSYDDDSFRSVRQKAFKEEVSESERRWSES
jgi:hypothetical protein